MEYLYGQTASGSNKTQTCPNLVNPALGHNLCSFVTSWEIHTRICAFTSNKRECRESSHFLDVLSTTSSFCFIALAHCPSLLKDRRELLAQSVSQSVGIFVLLKCWISAKLLPFHTFYDLALFNSNVH